MAPPTPLQRGHLLPAALELYLGSFRRCVPVALIGALAGGLVGAYAALRLNALMAAGQTMLSSALAGSLDVGLDASTVSPLLAQLAQLQAMAQRLLSSPAVWASYLGASLVTLACHGVLIERQDSAAGGTSAAADEAGYALRRMPALLVVAVLLALANSGAAALLGWLEIRGDHLLLLLVLAVGIWLWGRLQLWLVAMFTEDLGPIASLQRSWQLVRGHWWLASGATTVPYLIVSVFWGLAALAAAIVRGVLGLPAFVADQLCLAAAAIFTLPILPALWVVLHRLLRERIPTPPAALR